MKKLFCKTSLLLFFILLPLIFGAWRDMSRGGINPSYVSRIQNGKTTKQQILLWFGDPQEVDRSPSGVIFKYVSYKDAPELPSRSIYKEPEPQSTTPFFLDEKNRVKRVTRKTKGEIVQSTLTVRFKPDGDTVLSHDYKEFDRAK
jgi:outer membrane protein assembly factor BamE (lipoprotein component of BamABCDE complex)